MRVRALSGRWMRSLAVAVAVALGGAAWTGGVGATAASAASGSSLTYAGCLGAAAGCTSVGGALANSLGIAVSHSGQAVYTASANSSQGSVGGNISRFTVGSGGALTFQGCLNSDGRGCASTGGSPKALTDPAALAVSPNDRSLYVADHHGFVDHLFASPDQGGRLTWDGCFSGDGSGGTCAKVPVSPSPLDNVESIAVAPGGGSVYESGSMDDEGAATHFFADPTQGQLSYDGCVVQNGFGGGACAPLPRGFANFSDAIAVGPTGGVYVGGDEIGSDGWLTHLFAAAQGQLSYDGCVSDDGSGGQCADIPGTGAPLQDISAIASAPDGSSLYALSPSGGAVMHFAVAPGGQLTFADCVSKDGSGGACADPAGAPQSLLGARALAVSPDGRSLYVASTQDDALVAFDIGPGGDLTFAQCLTDKVASDCTTVPAGVLGTASGVAVSADGRSVYATSSDGTLSEFARGAASSGSGGGGGPGGSGGSSGSATASATTGNEQLTLSVAASACLARHAKLHASVSATKLAGSKGPKLHFARATVYVDRGVRHVRHRIVRRHGHKVRKRFVVHTPNLTVHRPGPIAVRIGALKTGTHRLTVHITLTRTVRRHHHRVRLTTRRTLRTRFKVC